MRNKKIGIITMHAVLNYGSYLQTFATYKFVEYMGYDPMIIDYHYPTEYHLQNSFNFVHKHNGSIKIKRSIGARVMNKVACAFVRVSRDKKLRRFSNFYKYVHFSRPYYTEKELFDNPPECDVYVAGSDQIWNPLFIHHDRSFFLSWVNNGGKKISYASSVAIKNIPDEFIEDYRSALSDFSDISVRENSNFLENLLGKRVETVLDPVFLLNIKEWGEYINCKPLIHGDYILCYILRYSYNPYPYIDGLISYVKNKLKLKVVMLDGEPSEIFKGRRVFENAGPSEFLNLFYHARFIITTSFHGTAFAINLGKNFISVTNDISKNDSRIESLAERLGLVDNVVRKNTPLSSIIIPSLNYHDINKKLEVLRQESIEYFKTALKD